MSAITRFTLTDSSMSSPDRAVCRMLRMAFHRGMGVLLSLICFGSASAWSADVPEPERLVRATTEAVLGEMKKNQYQANDPIFVKMVEEKALTYVDFNVATAFAVGKHWRDATPVQRTQLVDAFKGMLVRTYSAALLNAQGDKARIDRVEVRPLKMAADDKDVTVNTLLYLTGKEPISVDFRMRRNKEGVWRIYDLLVSNISLVASYRDDFDKKAARDGIEGLIADLDARKDPPPIQGEKK